MTHFAAAAAFLVLCLSSSAAQLPSLVGYITQLGQHSNNQRFLFDLEGEGGASMPGWYAQAHILASITGEKYAEINPGTFIRADPVKN